MTTSRECNAEWWQGERSAKCSRDRGHDGIHQAYGGAVEWYDGEGDTPAPSESDDGRRPDANKFIAGPDGEIIEEASQSLGSSNNVTITPAESDDSAPGKGRDARTCPEHGPIPTETDDMHHRGSGQDSTLRGVSSSVVERLKEADRVFYADDDEGIDDGALRDLLVDTLAHIERLTKALKRIQKRTRGLGANASIHGVPVVTLADEINDLATEALEGK